MTVVIWRPACAKAGTGMATVCGKGAWGPQTGRQGALEQAIEAHTGFNSTIET